VWWLRTCKLFEPNGEVPMNEGVKAQVVVEDLPPAKVDELFFYVVRNSDGEFFRAKGYGGYGQTWVSEITKARVYTKIGPARASVSYFANHFPEYPPPMILKMGVGAVEVIDEVARIEKQKIKKQEAKERANARQAKRNLEYAKKQFEESKARLERLKRHEEE
jgi:hypothetical protein